MKLKIDSLMDVLGEAVNTLPEHVKKELFERLDDLRAKQKTEAALVFFAHAFMKGDTRAEQFAALEEDFAILRTGFDKFLSEVEVTKQKHDAGLCSCHKQPEATDPIPASVFHMPASSIVH